MSLAQKLSKKSKEVKSRSGPVWLGPESDKDQGGVTFSLLSKWLVCRERFRILTIKGLQPRQRFSHRLEYGNLGHACEEGWANRGKEGAKTWEQHLEDYYLSLKKKYLNDREEVDKWYRVCKIQFPIYAEYWSKHPDMLKRISLLSEGVFHVPYRLPSGRTVYLKGKRDSVDLVTGGESKGIWVQENKYKGDIDFEEIRRQLGFDLQTMMYFIAFLSSQELDNVRPLPSTPVVGIRYNIVRRPLSGGKGTIRRHQATKNKEEESWDCYYERLRVIIAEDPAHYFQRWNVKIAPHEVENFRRTCLDPILENLCYWYDCETGDDCRGPLDMPPHNWIHPFGVYNVLNEGGSTEMDHHIENGSEVGLERVTELFPELKS